MKIQEQAIQAAAKAIANRHNFRDPSPYVPDAQVAVQAVLQTLGITDLDQLAEFISASEELRQGIREAGVKRDKALYSRVMSFDGALNNLKV